MGTLTADEALKRLYDPASTGPGGLAYLESLVKQTSGAVPGATATTEFLTYGGNMLPDVWIGVGPR